MEYIFAFFGMKLIQNKLGCIEYCKSLYFRESKFSRIHDFPDFAIYLHGGGLKLSATC